MWGSKGLRATDSLTGLRPRIFIHLYILHRARLGYTQHVEQLQDQLLDVLQRVLLCREVWVDLLLHLNVTKRKKETAY